MLNILLLLFRRLFRDSRQYQILEISTLDRNEDFSFRFSFSCYTRIEYVKQDVQPSIGHERSGSSWGRAKGDRKYESANWWTMELACSDCAVNGISGLRSSPWWGPCCGSGQGERGGWGWDWGWGSIDSGARGLWFSESFSPGEKGLCGRRRGWFREGLLATWPLLDWDLLTSTWESSVLCRCCSSSELTLGRGERGKRPLEEY